VADRTVVLGVTGSIAAYKAVDLASRMVRCGVGVHVVMTRSATELVGPATFRAITGRPVATKMFDQAVTHAIEHISLADRADALVIVPATANVIAKLATGIADDLLTCTALATRAPLVVAPAMHTAMYEHPATQENLATLRSRGAVLVGPSTGRLASGGVGAGRLAPTREILGEVMAILGRGGDLAGRRILVTAGGTREPIDPVRFLGNRSSGKMGFAIAEAARDRGAAVTLVVAATSIEPPAGVRLHRAETADEMLVAVREEAPSADALIMAAAVADVRPSHRSTSKIRKTEMPETLALEPTPDVLASTEDGPIRVGFAAETDNLVESAQRKLVEKRLDLIVANDLTLPGAGVGSDDNEVILLDPRGETATISLRSKRDVAEAILDRVVALLAAKE